MKYKLISLPEINKLLPKNQYGFRSDKSTTCALYTTTFIYNELDNNQNIMAIILDLAKAFDTVDHNKLKKFQD